jgi:hypothetical protein
MTRTEDRLIAALESAAAEVRVEAMRPLAAGGHARRRRAWLAAVLPVAASIAAIAFLAVLNSQEPSSGPVQTAAYIGGSEPLVPAFFVDAGSLTPDYGHQIRVISLATGQVTSTEHFPAGAGDITFVAEQPQTGNFVAAFISNQAGGLQLYRFRITGTGKITPLTRIEGILLRQQPENIAVLGLSPDGSRLALSLIANTIPAPGHAAESKIILLNLATGARQVRSDRLTGRDHYPRITSAAWTRDGRALTFAAHICRVNSPSCFWEFRQLIMVGSGLRAGPVLLRRSGMNSPVQSPAISPDGLSAVEVRSGTGPGTDTSLVRIRLATGVQTVLHRWRAPGPFQVGPNEGNFLVVGQRLQGGNWRLAGWVSDAGFHSLDHRPAA